MKGTAVSLLAVPSKNQLPQVLHSLLIDICTAAIKDRGTFTIALSGGSLPSFLSDLNESFISSGLDPQYDCWHVLLADERCVPSEDPENNLSAIRTNFLAKVSVPEAQIYGIDESKLNEPTTTIAMEYEKSVRTVLALSGGYLDLAILGFGPDGHTCSLFPGHPILLETNKLVAAIDDSPKPPPRRVTLTLPVLNTLTRNVIFCGTGESKSSILKGTFATIAFVKEERNSARYEVERTIPAPYPSGMVVPSTVEDTSGNSLTWIVDADAMKDVNTGSSRLSMQML